MSSQCCVFSLSLHLFVLLFFYFFIRFTLPYLHLTFPLIQTLNFYIFSIIIRYIWRAVFFLLHPLALSFHLVLCCFCCTCMFSHGCCFFLRYCNKEWNGVRMGVVKITQISFHRRKKKEIRRVCCIYAVCLYAICNPLWCRQHNLNSSSQKWNDEKNLLN